MTTNLVIGLNVLSVLIGWFLHKIWAERSTGIYVTEETRKELDTEETP